MNRRDLLATLSATAPLLAGCGGDGGAGGDGTTTAPAVGDGTTATSTTVSPTASATPTAAGTTASDGPTSTAAPTTGGTAAGTTTAGTTAAPTTTAADLTATVSLVSSTFDPVRLDVAVGTTVTWTNEDGYDHDVTSATFSSGATSWDYMASLGAGESASHTFQSAGAYEYYCTIHGQSSMCGVVVVGDVSYDGDLPCTGGGY
ncbi:MAG: plastocyanin/azurin family copper-binding protein [Halobacteriaceae archaeon]